MILGRSARNKKNDDPTPDEHIPLVRLDHSRFDPSQYLGSGPKADVVAARKEEVLDDMEVPTSNVWFSIRSGIPRPACELCFKLFNCLNRPRSTAWGSLLTPSVQRCTCPLDHKKYDRNYRNAGSTTRSYAPYAPNAWDFLATGKGAGRYAGYLRG
eukprot:902410-Amorphochlora_amoeboformis.AAC.1